MPISSLSFKHPLYTGQWKYHAQLVLFLWDKDFIALAEQYLDYEIYIFLISQKKTWRFIEVLLMSSHKICFLQGIRKNDNFQTSKSELDKCILTIHLSMDKK